MRLTPRLTAQHACDDTHRHIRATLAASPATKPPRCFAARRCPAPPLPPRAPSSGTGVHRPARARRLPPPRRRAAAPPADDTRGAAKICAGVAPTKRSGASSMIASRAGGSASAARAYGAHARAVRRGAPPARQRGVHSVPTAAERDGAIARARVIQNAGRREKTDGSTTAWRSTFVSAARPRCCWRVAASTRMSYVDGSLFKPSSSNSCRRRRSSTPPPTSAPAKNCVKCSSPSSPRLSSPSPGREPRRDATARRRAVADFSVLRRGVARRADGARPASARRRARRGGVASSDAAAAPCRHRGAAPAARARQACGAARDAAWRAVRLPVERAAPSARRPRSRRWPDTRSAPPLGAGPAAVSTRMRTVFCVPCGREPARSPALASTATCRRPARHTEHGQRAGARACTPRTTPSGAPSAQLDGPRSGASAAPMRRALTSATESSADASPAELGLRRRGARTGYPRRERVEGGGTETAQSHQV